MTDLNQLIYDIIDDSWYLEHEVDRETMLAEQRDADRFEAALWAMAHRA